MFFKLDHETTKFLCNKVVNVKKKKKIYTSFNPFNAVSRSQRRGVVGGRSLPAGSYSSLKLPKTPERTVGFLTRVRRWES